MASQVPLANQNHVWLRIRIPRSRFKNTLIGEENGILAKPSTTGKPQASYIIERINQVLGNFIQMFELDNNNVYEDWSLRGILVAEPFATHSRFNKTIQNHPTNYYLGDIWLCQLRT